MLDQQNKRVEKLQHRLNLVQKENERLGKACDDADEEVSDLKQQIFELLRVNAKLQAEMVCFRSSVFIVRKCKLFSLCFLSVLYTEICNKK